MMKKDYKYLLKNEEVNKNSFYQGNKYLWQEKDVL